MKPRLFWTILLVFTLVIVLGVCGMLTFFGLAVAGVWQPDTRGSAGPADQHALAEWLADYYIAHDNTWTGVDHRLAETPFTGPLDWFGMVLVDADGRVVASTDRTVAIGEQVSVERRTGGLPVEVGTMHVATLLQSPNAAWSGVPGDGRGPPAFVRPILRSLLLAGLALASGLLLLAVVFAQRLSRPLRRITAAAQTLAAGTLDVQVDGAPVRELDDLAQAFNHMAHALAQADQQRRQMTADIAHELRTPLTIIKGRLEGMQDGIYRPTPEQIDRLLTETALLERLVEDLRLLALAEAGQLQLYCEPIAPHDLLAGVAATFVHQAEAQGVMLHIAAPTDLPEVDVDPQRMTQVLANLVTNALRATVPGGTITLAATSRADYPWQRADTAQRPATSNQHHAAVIVEVHDTGSGIAPEDLPHIFDRFWRADRARARGSGGADLA